MLGVEMYQKAFIYQAPYQAIAKSGYIKIEIMIAMLRLNYYAYVPHPFSSIHVSYINM